MFRCVSQLLLLFICLTVHVIAQATDIKASIVKVTTTSNTFNYKAPWLPPSQDTKTGTGFVIDKQRIITNAHVVANAAYVEVRLAQQSKRYEVKIKAIGHDCDLAVLEPIETEFFEQTKPLKFGDIVV